VCTRVCVRVCVCCVCAHMNNNAQAVCVLSTIKIFYVIIISVRLSKELCSQVYLY